jgi:hypothetical protein
MGRWPSVVRAEGQLLHGLLPYTPIKEFALWQRRTEV